MVLRRSDWAWCDWMRKQENFSSASDVPITPHSPQTWRQHTADDAKTKAWYLLQIRLEVHLVSRIVIIIVVPETYMILRMHSGYSGSSCIVTSCVG